MLILQCFWTLFFFKRRESCFFWISGKIHWVTAVGRKMQISAQCQLTNGERIYLEKFQVGNIRMSKESLWSIIVGSGTVNIHWQYWSFENITYCFGQTSHSYYVTEWCHEGKHWIARLWTLPQEINRTIMLLFCNFNLFFCVVIKICQLFHNYVKINDNV